MSEELIALEETYEKCAALVETLSHEELSQDCREMIVLILCDYIAKLGDSIKTIQRK